MFSAIPQKQKNAKGGWYILLRQNSHSGGVESVELSESESMKYEETLKVLLYSL